MTNLVKKVQNAIFQYELFSHGSKIILAVSGGPDSVCLLDVFSKLKTKYNLSLIIAHVNYGLRGKDSNEDEKFVRGLAEKYGLDIFVLDLAKTPRRGVSTSENALREVRYNFFEKLRADNKFDFIAVAHNLDDQAETFLMRIIRGAGLIGLSAMKFKNQKIIRPLLGTTRREILEYLKQNKLKYCLDKTNRENKFNRNKVRNKLLPYLEKSFNPQIKKTIFDATLSIAHDNDLISRLASKAYQNNRTLNVKKLLILHPALQKRIILLALAEKHSGLKDIEAAHVEEILKIVRSAKNKRQVVVFKGLKAIKRNGRLIIENNS